MEIKSFSKHTSMNALLAGVYKRDCEITVKL